MNTSMQMPERVQIEETEIANQGRYVLQPLEEGYGVTIGNALRRVLLSSIPGHAIVGVKIGNALHEFETIPGVVEDMCEIVLNLKEVRFRLLDKKNTKISFKMKGPKIWTAADIQEAAPHIEVMDPDKYIATLESDAEFDVEFRIGKGKGYVPSEEQNSSEYPMGMIPIDAIFTPIKNVIYTVEPFRVGQKTDYERLALDVYTDGTLTAQEAIQEAAAILQDHLMLFVNFEQMRREMEAQEVVEEEAKEAEKSRMRRILFTPVDELELSVRAHNCLKAANIKTLAELVSLNEQDLLKFRNFGRKSLSELADIVRIHGLAFGMNIEKYVQEQKAAESEA
ncbi:MAG: DNA-directed polymerase alpha chain [Bacteroidota bacterium]|jgi:DNA-directed RNA polymerase subunit alpha